MVGDRKMKKEVEEHFALYKKALVLAL